ncbi:MAG: acyltransferase family protein [Nitrososphaerales archaeon]
MKDIPEITGMRGYASQAVIIFHFLVLGNLLGWLSLSRIALAWNSGVDFFFVLSGFLLTVPFIESSLDPKRKKLSLREFYIKRAFRILPVYYLSLGIAVLVFSRPATFQQLLASIFFLQSFSQSTFNSINGVSWTLVIEEIFYATLPVFSIFFLKRRWMYSLPACFAISIIYRIIIYTLFSQNSIILHFYMWQYPSFLVHYAIGCVLANLYVTRRHLPVRPTGKFVSSLPMLASIIVLLATQYWVGMTYLAYNDVEIFPALIFAFEYGALIYLTLVSPPAAILRNIFTNRLAQFTGRISYSVYSIHLPVLQALSQIGLPIISWIAASYVIVFFAATLTYYFVEKPYLQLRNKILNKIRSEKRRKEKIAPLIEIK